MTTGRYGAGILTAGILALALAGCSAPPADLERAVATIGAMLSPRGLERSAFYAVHPDGTPSDFVSFVLSPLGKAEWMPDDPAAAPDGVALVSPTEILAVGGNLPPDVVGIVADEPERRIRRQVVLRGDDDRGMIVASAYETPSAPPVLVREWPLPHVALAAGVAEMARENLELGVDAGAE